MADEFERVYSEYGTRVYSYLARLTGDTWTAEELCQETFVRYLRHKDRLYGANGTLGTWLYRVATNLARDRFRRRRRSEPLGHEPVATGTDGAERSEARDLGDCIRREVGRLPDDLREVFLLRAHQELTYRKVAEALSISERNAKERFRRAREILAHRLTPLIRKEQ